MADFMDTFGIEWSDSGPLLDAVRAEAWEAGLEIPPGELFWTRHWSPWNGGYTSLVLADPRGVTTGQLLRVLEAAGWVASGRHKNERRVHPGGHAEGHWLTLDVYGEGRA